MNVERISGSVKLGSTSRKCENVLVLAEMVKSSITYISVQIDWFNARLMS